MALSALARSPLAPFRYVSLRDPAIDEQAMGQPAHTPPQVAELAGGQTVVWSRMMQFMAERDAGLLAFKPGVAPTIFTLSPLSLAQAQTREHAVGPLAQAILAVRYGLLGVEGYTLDDGSPLEIVREQGPAGEWARLVDVGKLPPWLILELDEALAVRSNLRPPFRPVLRPA